MAGIPKYIPTPELLWQYFTEYEADVKARPFIVKDYVGKDGQEVDREKQRCLSTEGFEDYLFEKGIINDLGDYFSNKEGRYSDFIAITKAIKRRIRRDQIEGGMAGVYNPSITQRLNGLVDKSENKDTVKIITVKRGDRHKAE
jgi:hypothetical protein